MSENIGRLVTRSDICSLASKVYLTLIAAANLIAGFKRTGISLLNSEAYDKDVLLPSVTLQELMGRSTEDSQNEADVIQERVEESTNNEVVDKCMSENIQQSQIHPITCTDSIGSDDGCQIDNFLDNRLEKAQLLSKSKQSKPR
jgi:hypothetical protein